MSGVRVLRRTRGNTSMADVLSAAPGWDTTVTPTNSSSPKHVRFTLFESGSYHPSTEPRKNYHITSLPTPNYGSFEQQHPPDEEDPEPNDTEEEEEEKKPLALIEESPAAKLKRRIKIGVIICFFFFLVGIWLFAQQVEPEVRQQLHDLIKGEPKDVLMLTTTAQRVDEPESMYFMLFGPSSVQGGERPVLGTWTVDLDINGEVSSSHYFDIDPNHYYDEDSVFTVFVTTNSTVPIALKLEYQQLYWYVHYEVLVGVIILVSVYTILVFELMHRTTTAMFGSFWAVSSYTVLHSRPNFSDITQWIDFNTLAMLFGMMVIVGMLTNTGFFEFAAVRAYKIAKGEVWKLLLLLCTLIACVSAFIDNVTTTLLFVPVTIRLCSVVDLDPLPFIVAEVLYVNMGGTATAIGDPPTILIVNYPSIKDSGLVSFGNYAVHVAPGIILSCAAVFGLLKLVFKNSLRKASDSALEREIEMWKRTAERIPMGGTEEEMMVRVKLAEYIKSLRSDLQVSKSSVTDEEGQPEKPQASEKDISQLEEAYKITDMRLFVKTISVLCGVIIMFFVNSFAHLGLNIVWIALLGAVILLIITDVKDMAAVLSKVEFGTLLFFAGLFVMMKSLDKMGVLTYFANLTADVIVQIPEGRLRLAVAISVIIWIGGTVGAFIDNIPFTQTMLPIVVRLTQGDLGLPLTPLVWALTYGCCLGGNATAIGASANVVAAGLAEQNGYRMTFMYFTKVGMPACFLALFVCDLYLIVTHVLIPWY